LASSVREPASSKASPSKLDGFMPADQREQLPDPTIVLRKKSNASEEEIPTEPYIVTPTPGADSVSPVIRKFKKHFTTEVLCGSFWGANLLVGSTGGLSLLDRSGDGKIYPLITKRKFKQLEVMESLGVVVAICGKKDKLRAYSLKFFKSQIGGTLMKPHELYQEIDNIQQCTHFCVARHGKLRFLISASDTKVRIHLWAPKPYFKFMSFREFDVQHKPFLVDATFANEDDLKLLFASKIGFHSVDPNTGTVLNVYVPKPQPKTGIIPLNIIHHNNHRILLHDTKGVMIDEFGDVVQDMNMNWDSMPSTVVLVQPNELLGWARKQIEMRDLETGELLGIFNHKKSLKLRFLASRGNRVYFASVQQGGTTQVYFMQY